MNVYVEIINEAIDYIEAQIRHKLSLSEVSDRFCISDFHFNRMFKTVSGITLKQYILGRKLTLAMDSLKQTNKLIIDIAYDFGFEYPEVFSRAFKKQFGLSPSAYRDKSIELDVIKKAHIVERDIINNRGVLVLKGTNQYLEEFSLKGILIDANTHSAEFETQLTSNVNAFIITSSGQQKMEQEKFYTVVSCHGNENGNYSVFCGRKTQPDYHSISYEDRIIPEGWYICFHYYGDMYDISEAFIDDLYRWIMVKEAKLNPIGIGMINVFNHDYPKNSAVEMLVPIKEPI